MREPTDQGSRQHGRERACPEAALSALARFDLVAQNRAMTRSRFALVSLITLAACSEPYVTPAVQAPRQQVARPEEPLCRFDGEWTRGILRTPAGGSEYVDIEGGRAQAALVRRGGELQLHAQVVRRGWTLRGRVDPNEDEVVRVNAPTRLHGGVVLGTGAPVRVLDARPGEVQVTMQRIGGSSTIVEFVEPLATWLPCTAVGLSYSLRDEGTAAAERAAFGLPREAPTVRLRYDVRAPLSLEPGGAPFVELVGSRRTVGFRTARDVDGRETRVERTTFSFGVRELLLLEEREGFRRVLFHHFQGSLVVGWLDASLLGDDDAPGPGAGGVLALTPEARELTVCQSDERLTVHAGRPDARPEPVGTVEPGTPLVRVGELPREGVVVVRPHPHDGPFPRGEGVVWLVAPRAPLRCANETYSPTGGLFSPRPPAHALRIRARVTSVRGLAGLAVGGACEVALEHRPEAPRSACRAEVRCGERVLYGDSDVSGFFRCEVTEGNPPQVRGSDERTRAGDGDAALSLDTAARTLVVRDDDTGRWGAFHVEANIDEVSAEPR